MGVWPHTALVLLAHAAGISRRAARLGCLALAYGVTLSDQAKSCRGGKS